MTLKVTVHGKETSVPIIGDLSQPGMWIESGPNRCHRISFFSQIEGSGGFYKVEEFTPRGQKAIGLNPRSETSLIPVNAGDITSTKTFDNDEVKIEGF